MESHGESDEYQFSSIRIVEWMGTRDNRFVVYREYKSVITPASSIIRKTDDQYYSAGGFGIQRRIMIINSFSTLQVGVINRLKAYKCSVYIVIELMKGLAFPK